MRRYAHWRALRWAFGPLALLVALSLGASVALASSYAVNSLVPVSGASPFANCTADHIAAQSGTVFVNSEVEPQIAGRPKNSQNLVGGWQQDRWSNGGARGDVAGVSTNGGQSWQTVTIPKTTLCTGGEYERATDPWVTIAPNGDVYFLSQTLNDSNPTNAMLVNKSTTGGQTWGDPITLIRDTDANVLNDKVTITADSTNSDYVYAIWDRLEFPNERASATAGLHAIGYRGPTIFARTTNGGQSWEPARMIFDPGEINQTIGNQIVVLPNGTLVNVFNLIYNFKTAKGVRGYNVAVIRSTDKGVTWSKPTIISKLLTVGVRDPETGQAVRTGDIIPEIAVDRANGALYVAWQDSRFSGGAADSIAFAKSTDNGLTWSAPTKINQTPTDIALGNQQAFTPTLRVLDDGTVGVTYYDFRNNTSDPATLPTDYFLVHSHNQGASWSETRVTPTPFDMKQAPVARGFFTGDYEGLTSVGTTFMPFFVQGGPAAGTSDVWFATVSPSP